MATPLTVPTLLFGTLVLAAACDDAATGPRAADLSAEEASALAVELDDISTLILSEFTFLGGAQFNVVGSSASVPVPINVQFARTRECPKGGSVTVTGEIKGTADRATQSVSTTSTATVKQNECAHTARGGAVLTLTGNPNLVLTASRKIENGKVSGPQIQTQKGGFSWTRSTGESGSCTVDLTSTFDPAARTHTVSGALCNRTVNVVRTRS